MDTARVLTPTGEVQFVITRARDLVKRPSLSWRLRNFRNYFWMLWEEVGMFFAHVFRLSVIRSELRLKVFRASGEIIDYGRVSVRKFTQAGGGYIVDAFANSVELEIMKYHALGTGSNAEANTDTTLHTEITSTHYSGGNRPTGTTEEGASAWIYKTVGSHTQTTAGDTITEHGVVSTNTGAYVLLDRHLFAGIALSVGDSLQSTYQLTFTPEA